MARKPERQNPTHPLHPRNWGQSLTIATVWALGQLPWRQTVAVGEWLGRVGYHLAPARRLIARRNLELCFPELDARTREALVKENFAYTGRGLAEIGLAWFGGPAVDSIPVDVRGLDNLNAAQADGRPVILLSGHFTCVEIAARLGQPSVEMVVIYKPVRRKPMLDQAILQARRRITAGAIPRDDVRGIIRTLRNGIPVWYAGDQDYGRRHSVFAPFFGVPAATITALTRLTRMSNAKVVPLFFNSKPGEQGYEIRFEPALENFPTGNDVQDAALMNQHIEAAVRRNPAQYLWIHRRFKRQEGRGINLYTTKSDA